MVYALYTGMVRQMRGLKIERSEGLRFERVVWACALVTAFVLGFIAGARVGANRAKSAQVPSTSSALPERTPEALTGLQSAILTLSAQVADQSARLDILSSRCVLALPPGERLRVARVPENARP